MKVLLSLTGATITFAVTLLSSGCQKKTVATNPDPKQNNASQEKTKPLQAADLVGYDGTKLRKSVDKIIQNNDKHNKELEKATEDH
jgi:ABC-type Zn uptake system ZnuABC Zn-binding protein ZnuA